MNVAWTLTLPRTGASHFWMAGGTLQDAGGFAGAPEESLLR